MEPWSKTTAGLKPPAGVDRATRAEPAWPGAVGLSWWTTAGFSATMAPVTRPACEALTAGADARWDDEERPDEPMKVATGASIIAARVETPMT